MLEKGRNHLLVARAAVRRARPRQRTTRSSSSAGTSSAPTRSSSRAPSAADDDDGDRIWTGRGQQPAVDRRRRRLPRRRQAPPLPRGRLPPRSRARADRGRRRRRLAGRLRRDGAVLRGRRAGRRRGGRRTARTRSRRGAPARTRCRRAPTCSARSLTTEAATRLGYHPYRAPTGVNSVEYDGRPACNNCGFCGILRLPDRRQGRPGRAAAPRAAHRPLRDPARVVRRPRSLLDASGKRARGVRYLDADGRRRTR